MAPSRAVFEERWLPGQEVRREDMTGLETTRRKQERKKEKKKKQEKEKEKEKERKKEEEKEEKKDDIWVHVRNRGRGRESTIISASDFFSPRFKSLGILSGELLRPAGPTSSSSSSLSESHCWSRYSPLSVRSMYSDI